ncbi:MAG: DUF1190 domain-containing protein [Alphaproteobacteria bacterium]
MKRSRSIRLVLLGSAGALMLSGCEDPVDVATRGQLFTDAQACESAYDREECLDAYRRAETAHVETAPKFTTREECEAEFGVENCTTGPRLAAGEGDPAQANAGGSWFMPVMMGYMMGRMMGGGVATTPVYRDTQNTAYTGNRNIGRLDSARMPPPARVAGSAGVPKFEMARRQAVARGGFGRTGSGASS